MAAGANQQLIASNLRQEGMISESIRNKKADEPHEDDAEMVLSHDDDKTDTKAALKQQNNKNKSKQQNSTNNDQKPTVSAKPEPKIQNVMPEDPTETVAKKPAPVELPPLPGSQTQDSEIKIKISGCMNSCGQHMAANIGLHGSSIKVGELVAPAMQVVLGGGVDGKIVQVWLFSEDQIAEDLFWN